ncbi:MAG: hypothetical protein JW947_08165 [Sedimentisphaerales bacterium]|nr:hypothetical protein [Sedimentisphaerales bacterium]
MTEVPPILLSAIICEKVIFDKITGMPSIINIIQNINAPKYPVRYPSLVFFCELTNGHGRTKTTIRLIEEQGSEGREDKVIFEQKGEGEFKDVKQVVSLALNLQGMVLPHEGEYRFQLFAEDYLLGERSLICRKITLPTQGGSETNELR